MHQLNVERFEAMVPAQTRLVRTFAPDATCSVNEGPHGYFCSSWRLADRGARELFVEQAGRQVTPLDLRVGIYFADAVTATSDPTALSSALEVLLGARSTLQPLGVVPTFTHGCTIRDETRFGWTDGELREWLTKPCDNRDLVWLWDLHKGEPTDQQIEMALTALVPVWLAWNALD